MSGVTGETGRLTLRGGVGRRRVGCRICRSAGCVRRARQARRVWRARQASQEPRGGGRARLWRRRELQLLARVLGVGQHQGTFLSAARGQPRHSDEDQNGRRFHPSIIPARPVHYGLELPAQRCLSEGVSAKNGEFDESTAPGLVGRSLRWAPSASRRRPSRTIRSAHMSASASASRMSEAATPTTMDITAATTITMPRGR